MTLIGRRCIYTSESEITDENIEKIISDAFKIHLVNAAEIKYLKEYRRGKQPVLDRAKKIRPEINERIVENHAAEIVSFKVGYIWGTPIQYVQRGKTDNDKSDTENRIAVLNEMMFEQSKAEKDVQLGDDLAVCGVGYRLILPNRKKDAMSPFNILNLFPENAFVVRSNDVYKEPVLGVSYTVDDITQAINVAAYSKDKIWTLQGSNMGISFKRTGDTKTNALGINPIIEYENNNSRMGSFEVVLGLLDAINVATSDRLNDIAQFVQSLLWLNNCMLEEDDFDKIYQRGGIQTTSSEGQNANVTYLTQPMNQTSTQTFKDDLYKQVLAIAGVPDRSSDANGATGAAIMLASGWSTAEAHARITEMMFGRSEKQALKVMFRILQDINTTETDMSKLRLSDVDIKFSRNRNDNLLTKTQGLLNQLEAGVHPLVALTTCGLYSDPEQVWMDSREFMEKWTTEKQTDNEVDLQTENPSEHDFNR